MKVAICSGRISGRWLEQGNELNKIKGVVESKYIFDQIMIKTCFHVNWSENPKVFNKKKLRDKNFRSIKQWLPG